MGYQVKFPNERVEKRFLKTLLKVSPEEVRNRIKERTLSLTHVPRPYGEPKIKPPIDMYNYTAQYRLRIGDYRVLYDVDDREKTVWVLALRKRSERTYQE